MNADKIQTAVDSCLEALAGQTTPFMHIPKLIAALELQSGWTESELWAVHARVIERLVHNQKQGTYS